MRVAVAFFLAGMIWSAGAEASSIVTLAATYKKLTPSIIELGEAAYGAKADPRVVAEDAGSKDQIRISPSIVALGVPEVTSEKVAAIGAGEHGQNRFSAPMVIRGGIVGDAFSPVATAVAAQPQGSSTQQAAAAPGAEPKAAGSEAQPATSEAAATPPSPTIKPE